MGVNKHRVQLRSKLRVDSLHLGAGSKKSALFFWKDYTLAMGAHLKLGMDWEPTEADQKSFAALYEEFYRPVFAIHMRKLRQEELARDLTQETFLQAWRTWNRYDPKRGRPINWLTRVAQFTFNNWINHNTQRLWSLVDLYIPAGTSRVDRSNPLMRAKDSRPLADVYIIETETWGMVEYFLMQIPEEEAHAFRSFLIHGLEQGEIARRLGLPEATVASRIYRAKNRLVSLVNAGLKKRVG